MKTLLLILPLLVQVAFAAPSIPKNRAPDEQKAVNLRVFGVLAQNGAIEGKEYRFDHTFTSADKKKLEALIAEIAPLGFGAQAIETRAEGDGTVYWIEIFKIMKFDRSVLGDDSLLMLRLAVRLGVYYDGWGAEIERTEKSPTRSSQTTTGLRPVVSD
jgi:regulator of RNase E activity RraB